MLKQCLKSKHFCHKYRHFFGCAIHVGKIIDIVEDSSVDTLPMNHKGWLAQHTNWISGERQCWHDSFLPRAKLVPE